ncbi:RpS10b [Drosophila busckii]|uniref:RpS10b n=1 Tax=Drosophila busckii TaxID=30019 RepID=A0A0M4EE51_DROBS|nr:RpS10b [Drosophila busckii]
MFIQKADRKAIYNVLFRSGVMFAECAQQKRHPEEELRHLKNLQVIKTMQSLKSRGYVSEQMAWRHYYWCLNNEGIEYLRSYLHMPTEVVPTTLQRRAETGRMPRSSTDGLRGRGRGAAAAGRERDERDNYRRMGERGKDADKVANVGLGTGNVQFRGGFGRGKK